VLELFNFFQLSVFFVLECNFAVLKFDFAIIAITIFTLKFDFAGFQKLLLTIQFYFVAADTFYCFPKRCAAQPTPTHKISFLNHWSDFPKQCFNFLIQYFNFIIEQLNFLIQYFLYPFFVSQFCNFKIHFPFNSVYFLRH